MNDCVTGPENASGEAAHATRGLPTVLYTYVLSHPTHIHDVMGSPQKATQARHHACSRASVAGRSGVSSRPSSMGRPRQVRRPRARARLQGRNKFPEEVPATPSNQPPAARGAALLEAVVEIRDGGCGHLPHRASVSAASTIVDISETQRGSIVVLWKVPVRQVPASSKRGLRNEAA